MSAYKFDTGPSDKTARISVRYNDDDDFTIRWEHHNATTLYSKTLTGTHRGYSGAFCDRINQAVLRRDRIELRAALVFYIGPDCPALIHLDRLLDRLNWPTA